MGRVAEPLLFLQHLAPIAVRMDFDGVVSPSKPSGRFSRISSATSSFNWRGGCGARRLDIQVLALTARRSQEHPSFPPLLAIQPTSSTCFDLRWRKGLKPHFTNPPGEERFCSCPLFPAESSPARRWFFGHGSSSCIVRALTDEQIGLLGQEEYAGQVDFDRLIDRLRIRLGEPSSPRPSRRSVSPRKSREQVRENRGKAPAASLSGPRPLHLMPMPREIRVMVSPSDDAEGRPIVFTHEQEMHQVVHAVGPERIAGRWWDGHDKTRDYFDVEDVRRKTVLGVPCQRHQKVVLAGSV